MTKSVHHYSLTDLCNIIKINTSYSDAITHLFNTFQVFISMLVSKSPMRVQISKSWWQTWKRKKISASH